MTKERRKHVRVAADVPASIADGSADPVSGTIANFSERGVFLRVQLAPEMHRPIHVHFILKPDHAVCEASGKVAWCAPHGFGVVFDDINDAFAQFVDQLATAAKSINDEPKRKLLDRLLGEADVAIE